MSDDETPDSEVSLVARLDRLVRIPQDIHDEVATWVDKREYVHTLAFVRDTPDTVATNYILRAQYAATAALYPRDPQPRMIPDQWMPGEGAMEGDHSSEWLQHVRAHEIICTKQMEQAGVKGYVRGMIQDTQVDPLTWIKMRRVEDPARDPLGLRTEGAGDRIRVVRYRALKRDWDADIFDDQDARYGEMIQLNRVLKDAEIDRLGKDIAQNGVQPETDAFGVAVAPDPRVQAIDELRGDALLDEGELPAVAPFFEGFEFDRVAGEDMRYDWGVLRPEDLYKARWVAQRVWMTAQEIQELWGLGAEEFESLHGTERKSPETPAGGGESDRYVGEDERENHNDLEVDTRGNLLGVWEFWDKDTRLVYRWIGGSKRFLDTFDPHAEASTGQWFPFFALQFNRVTNKLIGPSDVDLLKPLQEELNMLRTHDREARKSSYPRFIIGAGLLGKTEKRNMRRPIPYAVIESQRASEIQQSIFALPTGNYNPALYEGSSARRDFEAMGGAPLAALGISSGADLATEVAVANQANTVQNDSRADLVAELLERIYRFAMEVNASCMSPATAQAIAGPGAPWLESAEERRRVLEHHRVVVDAVPNSEAASKQEIQKYKDLAMVAGTLQLPLNRLTIMLEILRRAGMRANLGSFVDIAALLQPPDEGPGVTNNPPAQDPGDQGDRGSEGGRPPTSEQGAPPAPESVPNNPLPQSS